ncbi:HTH domain-containing protein [Microbacterium sp. SLBN-146]|uniref:HTH domain-containing protein n=1 Tax=Microbacterium sp. SLBN-146 TaxID=2768457 RepID=UPI0011538848|nr:HTH domain-containing protein [Microbacterium sp. SLBN-146]TQJ31486.1 hypothetical protein FBY39_1963 [Microbacterium sp. SLBN-146]
MTQSQKVAKELNRLLASGHISLQALTAITRIDSDRLTALLHEEHHGTVNVASDAPPLTDAESTRVSVLTALLTHVAEIDDDERLRGILESLTAECRLTLENIAQLTRVDLDDLKRAVNDPGSVSPATKYTIALRCSYLINAANLARPREELPQ